MLDIKFIRENKDLVAQAAQHKNRPVDLDRLLELDDKRRELLNKVQTLREERNTVAKEGNTDAARARGKELKDELKVLEEELTTVEAECDNLMIYVVNVPLPEVPIGKDESGNQQIKTWGTPRTFDFPVKDHVQLGEDLDLLDLQRGSKISGFRGYFVKNQLAQLQLAVLFWVFQKLVAKGYTPIIAPSVIKGFTLFGSGHFPWGKADDVYDTGDDTFLSGTAEIPVTAYHSGETLLEKDLPKRFVAISPCFRREAGAYGRDTKGILRVHEFWKIEQVILAPADIDKARELHQELHANTEEIMQELDLPYEVLLMCTGDMVEPQMLKYDTQIWVPSQNTYREIASNSIMGDFQARRLNIRYKASDGTTKYVYTLNDTGLPSTRALIAIMENNQQADGSITVPKVLQSLVGFDTISA